MSDMSSQWFPPRGAVIVGKDGDGRWLAECSSCGWSYANVVRSDVNQQKAWHRCPAGTPQAYPLCPVCRASGRSCKRPSGHEASEWHAERVRIYDEAVRGRDAR